MKVLSLFDGIACGYEALSRAGISIDAYYASEIDKYAIKVAMKNHPDIIQVGDVTKLTYHDGSLFGSDGPNDVGSIDGPFDLIIGGSPCFVKGTKVWTYDGYKDISEVEVGDYVLGHGGKYNQVLKTGGELKEIWSIKGQGFLETFTTENHPYYVSKCKRVGHNGHRELQEPEWKEIKNIEKGDYVGFPIIQEEVNNKGITEQEARLLGRYMADGHTRKDFRKNREGEKTNRRYYGVVYSIGDGKLDDFNHITEYYITRHKHTQSTYRFIINSKRLVELCEDIGCGAINKSIPKYILDLPKELLLEFFKGYMSGDGYYKGNGVRRCSTISREMAMSLCLLSAKLFNTGAHIYFYKKPKIHIIQGRIVNQNNQYEVEIREWKKAQDHYIYTGDYIWFPVRGVRNLGYEDMVYNLEVENTNSYTANNIVVHNCQNLSAAGNKKGLEGEKSSLFYEFVRLVKEVKPKYFLLENVKMKKERMEAMSKELWNIKPTLINSALVSGQHRKRNYRVGKLLPNGEYARIEIPQPEDKGILLKDILQDDVDEKYYLSEKQINMIANWGGYEKPLERIKTGEDKMDTLTTHCGKMSNGIKLVHIPCATQIGNSKNFGNSYGNNKAYTLRACNPNGVIESINPTRIRKLTPEECEMLQNLNPGYTEGISDTQRYKALGNGWTVNVLAHIFTFLKE